MQNAHGHSRHGEAMPLGNDNVGWKAQRIAAERKTDVPSLLPRQTHELADALTSWRVSNDIFQDFTSSWNAILWLYLCKVWCISPIQTVLRQCQKSAVQALQADFCLHLVYNPPLTP